MRAYSDFFKTLHDEQGPTGYLGRGTHYSVLRAVVFHDRLGRLLLKGSFKNFVVVWDEDHDTRVMEPIEEIYQRGLLSSFLMFGERKGCFTAIVSDEFPVSEPALSGDVDELALSIRSSNCLKNANIVQIGDLVQRSEAELIRIPNLGRTGLNNITEALSQLGLKLRMELPEWTRLEFLNTEINTICQSLNDPWTSQVAAIGSDRNPIIGDNDEKVSLYLNNLEMLWQLGQEARRPENPPRRWSRTPPRFGAPVAHSDGNRPRWTTDLSEADRDPAFG